MNQYFGLMNNISKEYRIPKGNTETEENWKARVLYSYLGQVAYSSLFDIQDNHNLEPASINHFKSRISDVLSCMLEMYPELKGLFSLDDKLLCDEIYNIFLNTGCIYHEPNRLTPCVRKKSVGKHISFLRGYIVEEKRFLSGLGSYLLSTENDVSDISLAEMFSLQSEPLDRLWEKTIDQAHFIEASDDLGFEYLRTVPPFTNGYWVDKPNKTGEISIARIGLPGDKIYYLYRIQGATLQVSELPKWQTEKLNYISLAVGNLYIKKVLPETVYRIDGELVELKIGYLFPPAEMNLIKLYSWPSLYSKFSHNFKRMMDCEVFEELRNFYERLGYGFKEE